MPTTRPPLARWVLLVAVIAGVVGMHVLTAGDGPGHGMLPAASMAAEHHAPAAAPDPTPAGPAVAGAPTGPSHGDMSGCILFLVVGGAVLLLVALARAGADTGGGRRRVASLLLELRRRGPPAGWPRLALNVIRV